MKSGWSPHRLLGLAALALILGIVAGAGVLPVRSATAQANFGTVTVQKQLLLANQQIVPASDLSGYVFTLMGPPGTFTLPATNQAGQTSTGVPPGDYSITEQPRAGSQLVNFTIGGTPVQGFRVNTGQTVQVVANNQVQGTGSIAIQKQIVDANGNPVANADASGFAFAVSGPNFNVNLTTPVNGIVNVTNLGPGNYTVTETPRQGFTFVGAAVDGVPVANGQPFPVNNNQVRQLIFQNRQGGGAGNSTVAIRKEIVDASGQVVTSADRSGFQFTITCGGFSGGGTSDGAGNVQITGVPAGSCQINEAARSGFTLVSIIPVGGSDIGNNGTFMIGANQTFNITVRNRGGGPSGNTEAVPLATGCNNVALTWAVGTALGTVAAGVSPTSALVSFFTLDPALGRFRGFSPTAPAFANDFNMVEQALQAVFACVSGPSTLNRPVR